MEHERHRQPMSLRFGTVAAALRDVAAAEGMACPAFRSPPGLVGVSRSIRWRDGRATVSVALRGRPWAAVVADMVEGVVAANRLAGVAADHCRARLWSRLGELGEEGGLRGADGRAVRPAAAGRSGEKAPGFAA